MHVQVFKVFPASDHLQLGFSDHIEASQAAAAHAAASAYSMQASTFCDLFPYHLVLDAQCRVLQVRMMAAGMM